MLTKTSAIFAGWYTEPYGKGEQRLATDTTKSISNETLYAYWVKEDFYAENGGIHFTDGQDIRYELKVDIMNQLNVQNKQHLRNVYDIYVLLDNNRIKIENAEIWVAIKLKEGARNFDHYKVAYLNKYGEMIEEYIPQVSNKKDELSF